MQLEINKYRDKYSQGWDKLREQRYQRMRKLGVIADNVKLSDRTAAGAAEPFGSRPSPQDIKPGTNREIRMANRTVLPDWVFELLISSIFRPRHTCFKLFEYISPI